MGRIRTEIDHPDRSVAGVTVTVRELVWTDGGCSFEVHRIDTGDDLTEDDCFDTMPTDDQIADRLAQRRPDSWVCRGCGTRFDARTDGDLIVDHVRVCDLVDGAGNPIGSAS